MRYGVSRRAALAWSLVAPFALHGNGGVAQSLDDLRFTTWGAEPLSYLSIPPYYLSSDELTAVPLGPPPSNSSAATRAELDELLRLQAARTAADVASILHHLDYAPICADFVAASQTERGRGATSVVLTSMPRTRALLDHVMLDVRWIVFQSKKRFVRARPDRLDARIRPCIPVPAHPAYPSSHAALGYLVGRVLGGLTEAGGLAALGVQIGREREVAGVHYPSDGVAGRSLAEAVFLRLQGNTRFTTDLEAARTEWPARAP